MLDGVHQIAAIVCEVGKISGINPDDDIYDAGFSSINALALLIELETACDVSIPDEEFVHARSPRAFHAIIERLQREEAA
jgi:acyl carrier protein